MTYCVKSEPEYCWCYRAELWERALCTLHAHFCSWHYFCFSPSSVTSCGCSCGKTTLKWDYVPVLGEETLSSTVLPLNCVIKTEQFSECSDKMFPTEAAVIYRMIQSKPGRKLSLSVQPHKSCDLPNTIHQSVEQGIMLQTYLFSYRQY